jgi:hypothetical protein
VLYPLVNTGRPVGITDCDACFHTTDNGLIRNARSRRPQVVFWYSSCSKSYIAQALVVLGFLRGKGGQFLPLTALQEIKPPTTPMVVEELLPNQSQALPQEVYAYQRKIGSLTYTATITRPDIARTTSKLAELLQNPSPQHHTAADQAIAYLYGTKTLAIPYGDAPNQRVFFCTSDAAYADDKQTRKSTEGYLFQLFGGPVDWRCVRQRTSPLRAPKQSSLPYPTPPKKCYEPLCQETIQELGLGGSVSLKDSETE